MAETIGNMTSYLTQGVSFGTYHSYTDWGLFLVAQTIDPPVPITHYVEVGGRNDPLDYTEFFGDIIYEQRRLSFEFAVPMAANFWAKYSEVMNAVQGQKLHIVPDTDPTFYYEGRVEVTAWEHDGGMGSITIEALCNPYKLKAAETIVQQTITGETTLTLTNSRKPVVPEWTTNGPIAVTWNGSTHSITTTGTFVIPEVQLAQGNNEIVVAGSGVSVTIKYREGCL